MRDAQRLPCMQEGKSICTDDLPCRGYLRKVPRKLITGHGGKRSGRQFHYMSFGTLFEFLTCTFITYSNI